MPFTNGEVLHLSFDYNSSGKITRVSSSGNNSASETIFDINYSSNGIILSKPEENSPAITVDDTIMLVVDNNNRVQKRIELSFTEFKAPTNLPHRTFTYDTTIYEYDAAGLLKKTSLSRRDSTWFNPGSVQLNIMRKTGTDTYTNVNHNLTAINSTIDLNAVSHQNGQIYTSKMNTTSVTTFQYTRNFANKMDFNNAAVLNELALLTNAPINPNYANLPDKQSQTYTDTDGSGAVISTHTYDESFGFGYTGYGFLKSYESSSKKGSFVYNQ